VLTVDYAELGALKTFARFTVDRLAEEAEGNVYEKGIAGSVGAADGGGGR